MTELALIEAPPIDLAACEALIERGAMAQGIALATIQENRLYRDEYASFEAYCLGRWQFTRGRAYQLIEGAKTVHALSTNGRQTPLPQNERQVRELAGLGDLWVTP